jgi:hypothetical protein
VREVQARPFLPICPVGLHLESLEADGPVCLGSVFLFSRGTALRDLVKVFAKWLVIYAGTPCFCLPLVASSVLVRVLSAVIPLSPA